MLDLDSDSPEAAWRYESLVVKTPRRSWVLTPPNEAPSDT